MELNINQEYHDMLDILSERGFFGELTLYFQNGNIESSRKSERNSKNEVKELVEKAKMEKQGKQKILVKRPVGAAHG